MKQKAQKLAGIMAARANRFIAAHPNIGKIVSNVGWLSFDTIFRMVLGLFISTWVARYLQPSYFGELNYAMAVVTLIGAPVGLGFNDIVVRDLLKAPGETTTLLGTAFFSRVMVAAVSYILLVIYAINRLDQLTCWLLVISALGLFTQALVTAGLRFKADLRSKQLVIASNVGFAVSALLRVGLVLARRPVVDFAWVAVAESIAGAIATFFIYSTCYQDLRQWRFSSEMARRLLSQSWPLILSAIAVTAYMRIDQVMLANMLGHAQVGVYTAATKLSEITYFIPSILSSALFPSIVRSRQMSKELYMKRLQSYYDLSAGLAYLLILPLSLASPLIIHLLYGNGFQAAASVLTIQVWALLFVYLGVAKDQFLINEGCLKFAFYSTMLGALLNVALNLYLIPRHGAVGASIATVATQIVTVAIAPFFYSPTRPMALQMFRAVFLPFRIRALLSSKPDPSV